MDVCSVAEFSKFHALSISRIELRRVGDGYNTYNRNVGNTAYIHEV
jgi:hypothetical protein